MFRCIELAKNGLGNTAPNPMVGCVIVHDEKIIGEGFTSPVGGNHAEVNAINSVNDVSLLNKATLYVSLEPCSHFGKTPPCTDLIIKKRIKKIVIGAMDSNSLVNGSGINRLKEANCEVIHGLLEDECRELNKRFFTFHERKRPYVILKWAVSQDGFIAPESKNERQPVWISNPFSRQLVHRWRTEEQAILVGTNTVLEDNPSLTARDYAGSNPIRVVLDQKSKINKESNVYNGTAQTIIITSRSNYNEADYKKNVKIETIDWENSSTIANQICRTLYENEINSVIIEGGRKTLQTFIDEGLWDEARIFYGSSNLKSGTKEPIVIGTLIDTTKIGSDRLNILINNQLN